MEIPIDPTWATGVAGAALTAFAAVALKLWNVAVTVGRLMEWREKSDIRHDRAEARIEILGQTDTELKLAIADLPNRVAERVDARFDELNGRIDKLIDSSSRRP